MNRTTDSSEGCQNASRIKRKTKMACSVVGNKVILEKFPIDSAQTFAEQEEIALILEVDAEKLRARTNMLIRVMHFIKNRNSC